MSKNDKQRWLAPEVVQTSAMDCGPASLKCLLEGFNIPVSYGRLREACQTNVDGTSIDRLEEVANQLGVQAEQVMIPIDHLFLSAANALPAMVVTRHADGATHFVVAWRKHGAWLQVMDPAVGRRWVRCQQFRDEIFRHQFSVAIDDWYQWAASDEFLKPLQQRLALLGASPQHSSALVADALATADWFGLATLDAAVRLVTAIVNAGGLKAGKPAAKLVRTCIEKIDPDDIYKTIPLAYWSVVPQPFQEACEPQLLLNGAVLLQIKARSAQQPDEAPQQAPLSVELEAALNEKPLQPISTLLGFLKADGLFSPLALCAALAIAVAAVLLETLLFRGVFDIAWQLKLPDQRLAAMLALLVFVAVLLMVEWPIATEGQRFGRHLETRLRMALLAKLPQLNDRYFQSRPVSDMAERSHSIALLRNVPALGIHFVQTVWDIAFTLVGISLLDAASSGLALLVTVLAISLPLLAQPLLNERDLRVRSHSGALFSFYLDALLGLVPIRSHRAEAAVSREHEGLLVEWARSSRSMVQLSIAIESVQALVCMGFVGLLLFQHFSRTNGVNGSDLLLVFWALKLPAIGQQLTALAHQYPAQRNILLRLLEPLAAPEEADAETPPTSDAQQPAQQAGVSITINNGAVIAAGHAILQDIDLHISAGEHVAIVGASGAGKSTLVGLLLGWHRLASGQLSVDGQALSGTSQQRLRRQTAWVDPAVQIWNSPFLDNLSYSAGEGSFDHMAQVIDAANLRGVLQKLPEGLQTYLGEGGALLSGGEGQRVRLGRALLQTDVRLALLDEPFRGMDRSQRQRLLNDARQWWHDATLLCISHDVAETLSFARVLVVEDGQIIEDGIPGELAACPSRYRELLDAEQVVRGQLWEDAAWRHIRVENGVVREIGAQP
ncbi:hypothetical protein JCM14076_28950 [Methylosoma difficile]